MTTRTIITEHDREDWITLIRNRALPFWSKVESGKRRSLEQNKLQHLWLREAAEQLQDESAEDKRAYCKLHFGVPILRMESDEYCAAYDKYIRPLAYEQKLALMRVPLDFPVTRLMTTAQKKEYLDALWRHFSDLGVRLTDPDGGVMP